MSTNPLYLRVLAELDTDAALSIDLACARFNRIPPTPSVSFVSLSDVSPTIFTSLESLDISYNLWLTFPIPSLAQASDLDALVSAADSPHAASLEVVHAGRPFYVPIWVLQLWPRLRSLSRLAHTWVRTQSLVASLLSSTTGNTIPLSSQLSEILSTLPFDARVQNHLIQHLRTSHLPSLIQSEWLSDDHINSVAEFVNSRAERPPNLLVLTSFFIPHLQRCFERSPNYNRRRSALDQLVMNGSVSSLLIPLFLPSHWVLIFIDITARCYWYTDTLRLRELHAPAVALRSLNKWLSCLLETNIELLAVERYFEVGQQLDSDSCGVAVISSIAHIALGGVHTPWTQNTTIEHRLRWAILLSSLSENVSLQTYDTFLEDLDDSDSDLEVLPWVADDLTASPDPDRHCLLTPSDCSTASSADVLYQVPTISPAPISKPTLRQTTLPFKRISEADYQAQEKQRSINLRAERAEEAERFRQNEIRKRLKKKTYERERKRAQRARRRQARQELEAARQDEVQTEQPQCPDPQSSTRENISTLSRPYHLINTTNNIRTKTRKHKGTIYPTRRINWCQEFLWKTIDSNARAVGFPWRPVDIVDRLQKLDFQTFQYLRPQRISQWRDHRYPNELRWTESHLHAIEAGSRSGQKAGQKGVFHDRPDVVETIKKCLLSFRQAGICLDLKTIRGYMVGVIQHHMPEAFSRICRSGAKFRCSERFVRKFLRQELGWSVRKATRAAQKRPPDVDKILLDAFLRMACTVRDEAIPACCIVNADQTQVVYNSSDQKTWNATGERQVDVIGIEDKRAFTLLVGVSLSGDALPFQAVYAGKTKRSCPDSASPGYAEATKLGFLLDYSNTDNYWCTFETMQRWVTKILVPYFVSQREKHGLPSSQRCILQIDCWSVHRSERFLSWMAEKYPWIDIKFIPANCTGLFQACDVGIQRVLKVAIQNVAHADIVAETVGVLRAGTKPEHVLNDQTLPTLRRRSVIRRTCWALFTL